MARRVGTRNDDTLLGTNRADTLIGRAGADTLYGYRGDDTLKGDAGDDVLVGGVGTNTLDGGTGFDTADYRDSTASVVVDLFNGTTAAPGLADTLVSIERVVGSAFGDSIAGGAGDDTLEGGGGDDVLYSIGSDNILIGGTGNDTASYVFASAAVTIDLRLTGPQANGSAGFDTLQGIEWLGGSGFGDTLTGDAGSNLFVGGGGDDRIDGGDGYDFLFYGIDAGEGGVSVDFRRGQVTGGAGVDTFVNIERVIGTAAADTFRGNAGVNQIQGAGGADTITLGKGADLVFFNSVGDSNAGSGVDRITDLTRADRVILQTIDADTRTDGDQAFHVVRAFSGAAGELTSVFDVGSGATTVSGDVDGDGTADLTILFDGNVTRFVSDWAL